MTGLKTPFNDEMQALVNEHRDWLSQFDSRYLTNWNKLLNSDNEAAMAEASVRRRLQQLGVEVEPNEDLDSGQQAPDFKCLKNGITFYVEVACIRIETAENVTGIPNEGSYRGGFHPLNLGVFNKCIQKVRQASTVDSPLLIAVGTWHGFAAMQFQQKSIMNMLLTGEANISWDINVQTGETSDTYLSTNLYPAVFLKPGPENNPGPAREPISGVFLCGFGMPGIDPLVVLNPNASHAFVPAILPTLEYGSVDVDCETQQLCVSWRRGGL